MKNILVVGAGLSGAVIARELAETGYTVTVIDQRRHVAGNCHTERDVDNGVMLHKHGPHIFHTDDKQVWDYVNSFGEFVPYKLQVKSTTNGKIYSLPINLQTINQFFGTTFNPNEAKEFMARIGEDIPGEPTTFEEQALKFLGQDLYRTFFEGYPIKQWGVHPSDLPASVLKRLPVRFDYNDNYFNHKYQGIPLDGYTDVVKKMLDHPNIRVSLNSVFDKSITVYYDHTFFSGKLDSWFDYSLGELGYRTLEFKEMKSQGDYQGCAVMSYPDQSVPYTRIVEHKHFTPWESHEGTTIYKEHSSLATKTDTPYYPIRLATEQKMLNEYIELAKKEQNVTFVGRLGTYRYLDMDVTIREALDTAACYMHLEKMPAFAYN